MATTTGYTPEQTTQVLQLYAQGVNLEEIGVLLNKSTRSVISKLVQQNAYSAPVTESKRLRKATLIAEIAEQLELEVSELESLHKATHTALQALHTRLVPVVA